MIKKRFFLLILLVLSCLFSGNNYLLVNAKEQNNINNISFQIKSGRTSSLLLSNDNKVYGWGLWGEANKVNVSKKLTKPTDITKDLNLDDDQVENIFTGEQHSFILTTKGKVFAFGTGEKGQLGFTDYLFKSKPVDITSLFQLVGNEKIKQISCGDDFNIVLTSTNRVLSFGNKEKGQLGIEKDVLHEKIYDISSNFDLSDGDYIIDIKCGASHTLALSKNGTLYGWGDNSLSQLTSNNDLIVYTPTIIKGIEAPITKIECGRNTSYVLTNQNQLFGFGSDSSGQLATHDPLLTSSKKDKPFLMNPSFDFESDEYIKDIISGYYFAIVKTNLNNYYSFGDNTSGQLANNSFLSTSVPQKIEYRALLDINDEINNISCGENHCIATSKNGHIFAWGSNMQSQLSEDVNIATSNAKIIDITYNFPPIINIMVNASTIQYQSYVIDVDVTYLDNQKIDETYYYISESETLNNPIWVLYKNQISFNEFEGEVFIHLKIESEKETYYYVSKPFFLDHVAPEISLSDKNNENFFDYYTNSTIFAKALDNNSSVEIVYYLDGNKYTTENDTISFTKDGNYKVYAIDAANNCSATIEFTIDTILPTITQIDNNLILSSSYSTRKGQITIEGSEALACYKLGYNNTNEQTYIALNDNESSFTINLKKGVNILTLVDLAGNQSLTYEIIYTPMFFQDTQLLLFVFGSIAIVFIIIIVVVYTIRAKRKLIK